MDNKKREILITGASSGIGFETAIYLAKNGYIVYGGVRRKSDKINLEKQNSNIKGVYIDVSISSSISKAFEYVKKHTDKLDVLINNAGIAVASPIECIDIIKLKEQFNVNTFGAVEVVQKFLPLLKNSKIINISSMAASGIFPYISPYCASKRALDILMNSFLLENKDNIKVISIKPAAIKTPIWQKSIDRAENLFKTLNAEQSEKYSKELNFLKQNALTASEKGIDTSEVVKVIEKVIEKENPKSSYDVGISSTLAQIVSKLPQDLINKIVKYRMMSK